MGETARTLGERRKEYLKQPSPTPWAYTADRTYHHRQQFQHHRQGGLGAGQDHQGINIHKGKQSYFKPKHWLVQPQSYMGQSSF